MKQVQTILVNFLGINVSKLVSIFIGFIITLFVTRILGPGGYGIVTLLYMIESILIVVFQSGFGQSIGRYIAISKGKGEKYNLIVAAGIAIALISSALVCTVMILLANIIKEYSKYILLFSIATVTISLSNILGAILYGKNELYKSAIADFLSSFIRGLSIILLVILGYGVYGYILGVIISRFTGLSIRLYYTYHDIIQGLRFGILRGIKGTKEMLPLVGTLYIVAIISYIASWIDQAIVFGALGITELGIYGLAMRIGSVINILRANLGYTLMPFYSMLYSANGIHALKETLYRISRYTSLVLVPFVFVIGALTYEFIPFIFGTEYSRSALLAFIYITCIGSLYTFASYGGMAIVLELKKVIITVTAIGSLSMIIAELLLLRHGSLGIVIGKCIGMIIWILTGFIIFFKKYSLMIDLKAYTLGLTLGFIGIVIVYGLGLLGLMYSLIGIIAWIACTLIIHKLIKPLSKDDIVKLKSIIGTGLLLKTIDIYAKLID